MVRRPVKADAAGSSPASAAIRRASLAHGKPTFERRSIEPLAEVPPERSGRSPTLQKMEEMACFRHWRDDLRVVRWHSARGPIDGELFRRGSGGDCKSPAIRLGWFNSITPHQLAKGELPRRSLVRRQAIDVREQHVGRSSMAEHRVVAPAMTVRFRSVNPICGTIQRKQDMRQLSSSISLLLPARHRAASSSSGSGAGSLLSGGGGRALCLTG